MYKLGLIGGASVLSYSIADSVWSIISDTANLQFKFQMIPISTKKDLKNFYKSFISDPAFIGFNIAYPWKTEFSRYVDTLDTNSEQNIINTVYKNKGLVIGANTDSLGIIRGLKSLGASLYTEKVLILGAGGAGLACAHYLHSLYDVEVYVYDIKKSKEDTDTGLYIMSTLTDVATRKYDIIINATPHGKYHFDTVIPSFNSPLDFNYIKTISNPTTILQEMNYLPEATLFLQMGQALGLQTIPGSIMLVYQALESFERYFGIKLSQDKIDLIITAVQLQINTIENKILSKK